MSSPGSASSVADARSIRRSGALAAAGLVTLLSTTAALAQDPSRPARDTTRLPELKVEAARRVDPTAVPPIQRLVLPATATITAARVRTTVNLLDVQDAVKYLPSMFVRKRNNGDTQSTLATRSWGVSSSARSLILADGVPLSALIANNNTLGGPRWGLVSPGEIARIDVMTGPFSAAYPGNSMGAVVEITTRQPDRTELSLSQTQAAQRFSLYGTKDTYLTSQTTAHLGSRLGKFSFWVSGNYANSSSQPLTYVTGATNPSNTTGGFAERNKLGAATSVLGATGLLSTDMINGRVKLGYDVAPGVRATYSLGVWHNGGQSRAESYLDIGGRPTFGGLAGFASGYYDLSQTHLSHAVTLRTDRQGDWNFEVAGSLYRFETDRQRTPIAAAADDTAFGQAGRVALMDGTGWANLDLKGAWHRGGAAAAHVVTFGAHLDRYQLRNPTFNVADWRTGDSASATGLATRGDGKTRTVALWAQDRWRLSPNWSLTLGGRLEHWRGYDGVNTSGGTTVVQPSLERTRFSPKAILAWSPTGDWRITASAAKAYRFPTATELYQLISTGATFTSPDPTLRPDDVFATELAVERRIRSGRVRLALFRDDVHDAIISQFLPVVPGSSTLYSYVANVDHVRLQGAELSAETTAGRVDLSGSATWLDSEILAISGRASATAPAGSAVGAKVPNVPAWRATASATWRATDRLALSASGRYSSQLYTTLDNADVNPNTWQGFASWFVMDARATARLSDRIEAGLGVDNLNNRKYFLFHPFPQRTVVGSLRFAL